MIKKNRHLQPISRRDVARGADPVPLAAIEEAFQNTRFGEVIDLCTEAKKKFLFDSLLKVLVGYHCGYTVTTIMKELDLITEKLRITKRGRLYMHAYNKPLDRVVAKVKLQGEIREIEIKGELK